jgi:hypothetical protein
MAPPSGVNMFRQTVATISGGMTTGRMNRARYRPRKSRPLVFSSTATSTPRMTWTTTLENAHHKLNRTSRGNSKLGIWSLDEAIRV